MKTTIVLVVTVVVSGSLVFVACLVSWVILGGGIWLSEVSVVGAELQSPDRLVLNVASCNKSPQVTLQETDVDIQVEAVAFSTPLRNDDGCQDAVGPLQLQKPLGDRAVIDNLTGQSVVVNQDMTPCEEIKSKIVVMSHDQSLEQDTVRVLSVETIDDVIVEQRGFRCTGIAVTTEGLAWVIYNEITHSDGTTYYGYDLSDTEPIETNN